ncbi:MAG: HAMP domain-containing histidine kinase [Spirochaetaceae bacterium]|nr:HAMP domain-containing histidine kinase [Spirochaetaceae bacterium]
MFRRALYRRVLAISLGASVLVAVGVGLYGGSLFRENLEHDRKRIFEDLEGRIRLADRLLEVVERNLRETGRAALLDLAALHDGGRDLLAMDQTTLSTMAEALGVDDIYLIGADNVVTASSRRSDLGLDLAALDEKFAAFLDGLRGTGRIEAQRLTVAARNGAVQIYQYFSPAGSDHILEVSSEVDAAFAARHDGFCYREFTNLLYSPYLTPKGSVREFDVFVYGRLGSWSIIRPGVRRELPRLTMEQAFERGESSAYRDGRLYWYKPIRLEARGAGFSDRMIAEIELDLSSMRHFALATLAIACVACGLAAALSILAARTFFDRAFVARIEGLVAAIDRVAAGERNVRFETAGGDEIASIAACVDRMIRELAAAEAAARDARAAETLGIMAGGLAHDINNLLAGAVGAASLLKLRLEEDGEVASEELLAGLELIERTGARGETLVRDLLSLASRRRPSPRPLDLADLAAETVELVRAGCPRSVRVDLELPEGRAPVLGDAEELRRVLLNLCKNGIQAMTDMRSPEDARGGRLLVSLASRGPEDASLWALSVADEGVGVPLEQLPHLFTPFFSTKSSRVGSGLGLAASKAIAESHGGRIEVESVAGKGSRFCLVLPAAPGLTRPGVPAIKAATATA